MLITHNEASGSTILSKEEWLARAPADLVQTYKNAQLTVNLERDRLIQIVANCPNNVLDLNELMSRSLRELEALAAMAGGNRHVYRPNDYSGAAPGFPRVQGPADADDMLDLPTYNWRQIAAEPVSNEGPTANSIDQPSSMFADDDDIAEPPTWREGLADLFLPGPRRLPGFGGNRRPLGDDLGDELL